MHIISGEFEIDDLNIKNYKLAEKLPPLTTSDFNSRLL